MAIEVVRKAKPNDTLLISTDTETGVQLLIRLNSPKVIKYSLPNRI